MSQVARLAAEAEASLGVLYGRLRDAGCASPGEVRGQVIRPVLSLAGAEALGVERTDTFWSAVAAVQLAHEASLLHDDVIDGAATRRSVPTLAASRGIAVALVEGDHLLTTGYRLAAATGSLQFTAAYTHAVERTVAGEKLQGRVAGLTLDDAAYRRIVGMKSGELLGCALAAAPLVTGAGCADAWYVLGRRIGTLYQMLDDLLDYCPGAATGKPSLGDYGQRRWTWPLAHAPHDGFDLDAEELARRLAEPDAQGRSVLRTCLEVFRGEAQHVHAEIAAHMPRDVALGEMVDGWLERAAAAVAAAERSAAQSAARAELAARLAAVGDAATCFRVNSRSFYFAARAFPPAFRARVSELYAFCRFTDDLADGAETGGATRQALLDEWERLAHTSYHGTVTGFGLSDDVMSAAAAAGVPFRYVQELIDGMRMDLRSETYGSPEQLRIYSYRVAGVIGQWLTQLCGIRDPDVLERAALLGHAMQLTNILRDVGEDLRAGRLYLPATTLRAFDVKADDLRAAAAGGPLPRGYAALMEHLMAVADRDYAAALEAAPLLPPWFRRAVVIAAHVYRGIHDAIRRNGYDNLTRRAHTRGLVKVRLAARALVGARIAGVQPLHAAPLRRPARGVATALLAVAAAVSVPAASVHAQQAPAAQRAPAAHLAELEAAAAAAPEDRAVALDVIRALYFTAVDDAALVRRGRERVRALQASAAPGAVPEPLLMAYQGAFSMLEAKHGTWPHARLRAVRAGLSHLDRAVQQAPRDPEIRYLRLVSTYYLPGLFGRRDSARDDLRVLAGLLPGAQHSVPPALFAVIADFVRSTGG